ncbi:MAG: hypothetical protein LBK94_10095 [Prevotellaceae bacterium]|jgi:hypothetical protein|nr:hypothetical protein [Prevotellaceae bacterium]
MKKLFYLITFALLVACCSKDDVSINTNPKAIVGNWKSTYYYVQTDPSGTLEETFTGFDFTNYDKYIYQDWLMANYLTFLTDTDCSMILWNEASPEKKYIYSYEVNNGVIRGTHICEGNYSFRDAHWGIVNNKLILAYYNKTSASYHVYVRL